MCGNALLAACRHMRHAAVKFLLDAGASVIERDQMMDTCLHIAVKNGDVKTVKVIMEVRRMFPLGEFVSVKR